MTYVLLLLSLVHPGTYRPHAFEDVAEWSPDPLVWEADLPAVAVRHGTVASALVWDGRPHVRLGVRVLGDFDRHFSDGGAGLILGLGASK